MRILLFLPAASKPSGGHLLNANRFEVLLEYCPKKLLNVLLLCVQSSHIYTNSHCNVSWPADGFCPSVNVYATRPVRTIVEGASIF